MKLFFSSLSELDDWAGSGNRKKWTAVLPYIPASLHPSKHQHDSKILVCHDYKGGYTETSTSLSYTFNFWNLCDTFIYFSHHRVTIPPVGWINAAHRAGTKILGVLIFEGSASLDVLRLLVGQLPPSRTGPAKPMPADAELENSLPVSSHYARLLAELAQERGFDGYLLNIECPLLGGVEQAHALSQFVSLLTTCLRSTVGPHAECIWYDSVIVNGQLRWQDRLNALNLPFWLPATGFFGNYTWPLSYPEAMKDYFGCLSPDIRGSRQIEDLYAGIDVWGRGSHGNGGFGIYKALEHIEPAKTSLSIAIFGQAWTWESQQDEPGWVWETWWRRERVLWLGTRPKDQADLDVVIVPQPDPKRPPETCVHGPWRPISDFATAWKYPPEVSQRPFVTTFSPGVGRAWFVRGKQVNVTANGWTDLDKQTSIGNLLWPYPKVVWEKNEGDVTLKAELTMENAWMGGSAMKISSVSTNPSSLADQTSLFGSCYIPIQSLVLSGKTPYQASAMLKIDPIPRDDLSVIVTVNSMTSEGLEISSKPIHIDSHDDMAGWFESKIDFSISRTAAISVGLTITSKATSSAMASTSILVGLLNVSIRPVPDVKPRILWISLQDAQLSWDLGAVFSAPPVLNIASVDDPKPAWVPAGMIGQHNWFPTMWYYNIYALVKGEVAMHPEDAKWIGRTGWEGMKNSFSLDLSVMEGFSGLEIRLYVQGVNDIGEVLPWERCAFTDVSL